MIRPAQPEDLPLLMDFLAAHIESSMFLLSNLETHGLHNDGAPHAGEYHLCHEAGALVGVLGRTNTGDLLCQHPGLTPARAQAYLPFVQGHLLRGLNGEDRQIQALITAMGWQDRPWQVNRAEPLFRLDLNTLGPAQGGIRAPQEDDRDLLSLWFDAYMQETQTTGAINGAARAQAAIAGDHVRLLDLGQGAQAMTAINARAGHAVQVGGVYVPDHARGQGLAGRMIHAHLQELKAQGAQMAILFAASAAVARAYEKIGFGQVGHYRVALLAEPIMLEQPPCP